MIYTRADRSFWANMCQIMTTMSKVKTAHLLAKQNVWTVQK